MRLVDHSTLDHAAFALVRMVQNLRETVDLACQDLRPTFPL